MKERNVLDFIAHLRTVEPDTHRKLVIFHHSDMDGAFAGASVQCGAHSTYHALSLKHNVIAEPVNYNGFTDEEILALVDENSDVFVVDFAFPLELSRAIAAKASFFVTIDHHAKSEETIGGEPWAILDMTSSGALMAWRYFNFERPAPLAVTLADNRDLWKKTDGREDQFHEVGMLVRSKIYDGFAKSDPEGLRKNERNISYLHALTALMLDDAMVVREIETWGKPVIAKRDSNIAYIASPGNLIHTKLGGVPAVLVNYGVDQSDVCEFLYSKDEYKDKIVATFSFKYGGINFSLRKNAALDVDLNAIASMYGGGGHKQAAGFVTSLKQGMAIIEGKEKWAMVSKADDIDAILSSSESQTAMTSALLATPVHLASRVVCETDTELLQWLPYLVLRNENKEVLLYQRPDTGDEGRIQGKVSVGLGGHVDTLPAAGVTLARHLAEEAARELEEEVGILPETVDMASIIEAKITSGDFGLLRMEDTAVESVHMGLAIILDVESKWLTNVNLNEVRNAHWVPAEGLPNVPMRTGLEYELWSATVVEQTPL